MVFRSEFLLGAGAAVAAAGLPFPTSAGTGYTIDNDWAIPNLGNVRVVTFDRTADRKKTQVTVAMFQRNAARMSIFAPKPPDLRYLGIKNTAEQTGAPIAMGGGFATFSNFPSGLLIVDGQVYTPANTSFSGALVIDENGSASVVPTADIGSPAYAIQGRPLFIDPGGKMGIHAENYVLDQRNFVAQAGDLIVAGTVSNITLMQLAKLFLEHPDAFGATQFDIGLNLAGAATAGFWAVVNPTTAVDDYSENRSPNIILINPKTA